MIDNGITGQAIAFSTKFGSMALDHPSLDERILAYLILLVIIFAIISFTQFSKRRANKI
ncbi:hypothetical protein HYV86_03115 [Candidatus Woesearchaeota archaeon]|nr:hypothetical protein [Candidatus Woesearchaeota archaeon]